MNKALILCAGRGSRLGSVTDHIPKPLVKVNDKSILSNTIEKLIEAKYSDVVLVIGYKGELIREELQAYRQQINIKFIENNQWSQTNNIYSLWLAKQELNEEVTLMEGDIYINEKILPSLNLTSKNKNFMLVSPLNNLLEGSYVNIDGNQEVQEFLTTKSKQFSPSENSMKTININRLSKRTAKLLVQLLDEAINASQVNRYYEILFESALKQDHPFHTIEVPNDHWYEVDDLYDLDICNFNFSKDQHTILKTQHGGYWRYPVIDFALIYNFHFPPKKLKEKLIDRFDDILLNYPSSAYAIEKHLSSFIDVNPMNLMVANGVSEIIKVLTNVIDKKVLLLKPSFNEYENSLKKDLIVSHPLKEEDDFALDVDDFLQMIEIEKPSNIVLISPDNPSGKIIKKEDIIRTYHATENMETIIYLDESFVDFSAHRDELTFINELDQYPRIVILKSMSKTFGIGGLRLGYAASANKDLLNQIRKELPIWNINGFAEEFIMNLNQFKQEYKASCDVVRNETDALIEGLKAIDQLKVFDSDSNFVLCKIKEGLITADGLASKLLTNHRIYIKECSGKSMKDSKYFIRVSSRTGQENEKLLAALKDVLSNEEEIKEKELVYR